MSWISRYDTSAESTLDFRVIPPCERLRPFVRYYWILKNHGAPGSTDDYLAPDGFEELIFSFEGHFRRTEVQGDALQRDIVERSYAVGCKTVGVHCLRMSKQCMVGVKLWPGSLYSLLGMPINQLRSRPAALDDIGPNKLRALEARLYEARSVDEIKSLLDDLLTPEELSRNQSKLVRHSVNQIFAARGDIGIDAMLRPAGVHYRTAERAFEERVGVSPKQLAKVIRFKHAYTALSNKGAPKRGAISPLEFGYYDASHFAKDFRAFTGSSPGRFLRATGEISTDNNRFCLDVELHRLDVHNAEPAFSL
jgi:AraC-like DNA-binding protein